MGCLQKCIFCNAQLLADHVSEIDEKNFVAKVNEYLKTLKNPSEENEIAFYGANFTNIEQHYQKQLLTWANRFIVAGSVASIRISTRADYVSQSIIDMLKLHGVKTVEVGAQSLSDMVLSASGRMHTAHDVSVAIALLKKNELKTSLHLMVGLPSDNKEIFFQSVEKAICMRPDAVRIHPTIVFDGTVLSDLYKQGVYIPLTLETAIKLCKEATSRFLNAGIKVIRIGLQLTESMGGEKAIIAGPYHPSFGSLVYEGLVFDKIDNLLKKNPHDNKQITILCSQKDFAFITKNRAKFISIFNLQDIRVAADSSRTRGSVEIIPFLNQKMSSGRG